MLDADGEGELSVSEFTRGRDDRGVLFLLGGPFQLVSVSDSAMWQTFNLLGITCLVGKIEFKLLHSVVLWLSKG